jgi:hypothetical protein
MTRISKQSLQQSVFWLNQLLGRPTAMFSDDGKMAAGHLVLDKNAYGYQLEGITSPEGDSQQWSARIGGADMALFISGFKRGIGLRNA